MHTGLSEWGARLAALPEFTPPANGWEAVQAVRGRRAPGYSRNWPVAFAAAVLAAAAGLAWLLQPAGSHLPDAGLTTRGLAGSTSKSVLAENARLEALLAALPETRVMRGSTAFTLAQLEDRIASVDDRLSRITLEPNAPEPAERLWRERVTLMNSLVQVRYADVSSPL
jgi:hypothetical protein